MNRLKDVARQLLNLLANRQYRQQLVVRSADAVCTARDAERRYCQLLSTECRTRLLSRNDTTLLHFSEAVKLFLTFLLKKYANL